MSERTYRGGRRQVRTDATALAAALPQGMIVIRLGAQYSAIILDLIAEFQATRAPIPQSKRDEIIARYVKSRGAVIMSQLREKGAIISDEGDVHHDKDVVPRYEGIIYVNSRTRRIVWPLEQVGKTLENLWVEREMPPTPKSEEFIESARHQVSSRAFVLPSSTQPIHFGGMRERVYRALIAREQTADQGVFLSPELFHVVRECGSADPASMVHALECLLGVLVVVSGTKMSRTDPCQRALVVRPFVGQDGVTIIPARCNEHPLSQPVPAPSPSSSSSARAPSVVRSRAELEEELVLTEAEIASKREECDRVLAQWVQRRDELDERVRKLAEQLQEANQALAAHSATSDGTKDLTAELTQLGTRAEELRGLIATYDRTLALLLRH